MKGIKLQLSGIAGILIGMWEPAGTAPGILDVGIIWLGLLCVFVGSLGD